MVRRVIEDGGGVDHTDRSPWPQRTTLTAGALLLLAGLVGLLNAAQVSLPITDSFAIPLNGLAFSVAAGALRAAGFVCAALGVRGEVGLAGRRTLGSVALVVWGLRDLGFDVLALLDPSVQPASIVVASIWHLTSTAAGLIAAFAVAHARVVVGWARWTLLPLAVFELLLTMFVNVPVFGTDFGLLVVLLLGQLPIRFAEPALLLLIATALLTWSRLEAVKHRARIAYNAW